MKPFFHTKILFSYKFSSCANGHPNQITEDPAAGNANTQYHEDCLKT